LSDLAAAFSSFVACDNTWAIPLQWPSAHQPMDFNRILELPANRLCLSRPIMRSVTGKINPNAGKPIPLDLLFSSG
jgi:hypothetical protein